MILVWTTWLLVVLSSLSLVVIAYVCLLLPSPSAGILDVLAPAANREFGLLETLQHLILIGLSAFLFLSSHDQPTKTRQVVHLALAVFVTWIFLEEVDYFLHFYDAALGRETYTTQVAGLRNVHNAPVLGLTQNLASLALGLTTLLWTFFQLVRLLVSGERRSRVLYSLIVLAFSAVPLGLGLGTLFPEDSRQVPSELAELTLYAAWALLAVRRV